MEQLRRLLQAVDDFQQRHHWLAFPVAVVKKYGEDQAGQRAALLAYYGFFSLFPPLLVAVTVLSLLPGAARIWAGGSSTRPWPSSRSSATRSATRSRAAGCGAGGWPWSSAPPWPSGAGLGWPRPPSRP
jgi:hypothetical protein